MTDARGPGGDRLRRPPRHGGGMGARAARDPETSRPTQARASRSRRTGSAAAPLSRACADQRLELALERDLLAQGGDAALDGERGHGHLPAVAGLADDQVGGGARAVEEHLAELRGAGELADRADRDARLAHRDEQVGQARAAPRPRLGAGEDEAPVGHVRQRRPHLLAGDHPLVAVAGGRGGHRGQVRTGARLGVALAPELARRPRSRGRKRRCCSGVPNSMRVGRAAPRPRSRPGPGAPLRAYSSWKMTCWRAAVARGRRARAASRGRLLQPAAARSRFQATRSGWASCSRPGPPARRSRANRRASFASSRSGPRTRTQLPSLAGGPPSCSPGSVRLACLHRASLAVSQAVGAAVQGPHRGWPGPPRRA